MLSEVVTVAALLLGWCGVSAAAPPEGRAVAITLLGLLTLGAWRLLAEGRVAAANARLAEGRWWGADADVRHAMTRLTLGGCAALAVWAALRWSSGQKLGGAGSLLVLLVVVATAAKLVAETYLYAQLGAGESARQQSARRLVGPLAGWAKARYALGAFGGVILPLGAQLLAGGGKNIPAVIDAGPPAVLAVMALACLVPGEMLERRLFRRA